MQTTLLGLATALILALIAALVGPYFIDWNQFRPQFEAEATRVIGAPVRVVGALDARLLPVPSLRLRSVVVGGANDPGRVRADKLDVDFSLGSLMRGEWRADELTINGFALDLGLDTQGKLDWPAAGLSNLAALTVDRLNLTGRIALYDAASRSTVELNDIAFSGELRAQAGSLRGDGNFLLSGIRTPFRLSSGRPADGNGTRLHLTLDPGARALSADLDGVLSFEARSPRFDGALILAAPAPAKANATETARTPWRISARVKADPAVAKFDQVEASWGAEDRALKLAGTAELRFGASPRLQAALSARQLDADRLLATDGPDPVHWLSRLRSLGAGIPQLPLTTQIDLSAEQIMLGGRPVQNLVADLRSDTKSWRLQRLELRAPGGSQLALGGAAASAGASDGFKGTLSIDSADPDLLAAWLQGRTDFASRAQKPLRAWADITVAADGFVLDALKAEVDGGKLEGRVAWSSQAARGSRLEAVMKADRLDLEAATGIVRSLAGPQPAWPDEAKLSLDIGRATSWGQSWQPLVARLSYGPGAIALEQLKLGAAGVTVEGSGAFDRHKATGRLALSAGAASLGQIAGAIAPVAPLVAARLNAIGAAPGAARATLKLELDKPSTDRGNARAVVEIDAPQLKGLTTFTATPALAEIRGFDLDALSRSELTVGTKLSSDRGQALLALLGLDRAIAAADGAARLEATASGAWRGPLRLKAHLAGFAVDADVEGSAEPLADPPKASLNLKARRLDLSPLLQLGSSVIDPAHISLASRIELAGNRLSFNDIDAGIGGSRLRGRLAVVLGNDNAVEGEAGIDRLDLAPVFQMAIGAAGRDQSEPLGPGLLRGWRGKVSFQALRGTLPGGSELQPLNGVIRNDGQALIIESKARIGGGDGSAEFSARPSELGTALNLQLRLSGVDAAALRYRGLALPAGRAALQMTLDSTGRSASALNGALSGGGTLTLDTARIVGLDPRAFEAAIRAGDAGQPIDDKTLERIVEPLLSAGALPVAAVQIPFSVKDGRLRVASTTLESQAARAVVSGGYDILADQADIRASLVSTAAGAAALRPEIQIDWVGPPDGMQRSIDVAVLSSWLAGRRIDRETRKLEQLERETAPPPVPAALPPPIKPLPAERSAPSAALPPDIAPDLPTATVPPERDPRPPSKPKTIAPRPQAAPEASRASPDREQAAPLPPPIEVRPAPGDTRPQRLRPPLVLTPQNPPRAAF